MILYKVGDLYYLQNIKYLYHVNKNGIVKKENENVSNKILYIFNLQKSFKISDIFFTVI